MLVVSLLPGPLEEPVSKHPSILEPLKNLLELRLRKHERRFDQELCPSPSLGQDIMILHIRQNYAACHTTQT